MQIYSNETKVEIEEIEALVALKFTDSAILKLYKTVIYDMMYKIQEYQIEESDFNKNEIYAYFKKLNDVEMNRENFATLERVLFEKLHDQQITNATFNFKFDTLKRSRDYCAHSYLSNSTRYRPSIHEVKDLLTFFTENLFIYNKYFISKLKNNIDDEIKVTILALPPEPILVNAVNQKNYDNYKRHLINNIYTNISTNSLSKKLKDYLWNIVYKKDVDYYYPYICHAEAILDTLFKRGQVNFVPYNVFRDSKNTMNDKREITNFIFRNLEQGRLDLKAIKSNSATYFETLSKKILEPINIEYLVELSHNFFNESAINKLTREKGYLNQYEINKFDKILNLSENGFDFNANIIEYSKKVNSYDANNRLYELLLNTSSKYDNETVIKVLKNTNDSQNRDRFRFSQDMSEIKKKFDIPEQLFEELKPKCKIF